jgi:hypothetical protein
VPVTSLLRLAIRILTSTHSPYPSSTLCAGRIRHAGRQLISLETSPARGDMKAYPEPDAKGNLPFYRVLTAELYSQFKLHNKRNRRRSMDHESCEKLTKYLKSTIKTETRQFTFYSYLFPLFDQIRYTNSYTQVNAGTHIQPLNTTTTTTNQHTTKCPPLRLICSMPRCGNISLRARMDTH